MIATTTTETVLAHHLAALAAANLAQIMTDYHDDAVFFTPVGPMRGKDAVEGFFTHTLATLPPGFLDNFRLLHQTVDGDLAYIVWQSLPFAPLATDTIIVRDGKIVQQTFAAFMPDGQ